MIDLRSSLALATRLSAILAVAGCGDSGVGPGPEPVFLDLGVRVVVDTVEFRSAGDFALDLVPSDRNGTSFVTEDWTISTTLSTPVSVPLTELGQEVLPPDTRPIASAILIDNSGSMRFSDPERVRASSAQLFWNDVLAARPGSVAALLDFGRGNAEPSPGFERTVLLAGFTSNPATLAAKLDQIQAVPGGATPLYTSATEVIAWMDTTTEDTYHRTLVVVTDGEPSDLDDADSLFAGAAAQQVRIFAVGVGAAADPASNATTLLRELASRTGGLYGAAESPTQLQTILRTLAKSASPARLLVHLRLDPAPASGTPIAGTVTVTNERGTASANWSFVAP